MACGRNIGGHKLSGSNTMMCPDTVKEATIKSEKRTRRIKNGTNKSDIEFDMSFNEVRI